MTQRLESIPLGEVAKVIRGITFKPTDKVDAFSSDSAVCFRTANVQSVLDESDLIAVPKKFVKREDQYVKPGDILVSTANSWNLVGKCCYVPKLSYEATIGGFISALRAKNGSLDSRYLYYWFNSPEIQILARNHGRQTTNISNMDINRFLLTKIPLPPLEQQRRIAAILDKADELRGKRRQAIEKLEKLLQSVFLEVFGDPVTNPKSWDVAPFGSMIKSIRYGTGSPPEYSEIGIAFVRATNIKKGTVIPEAMKFISEDEAKKIEKCLIKTGDLIIVRSGVNSGDCALIPAQYDGAYAGYDLIVETDFNTAVFANHYINSPRGKQVIEPLTRRAGQPHLNADQIKSLSMLRPGAELLEKFAQTYRKIGKEKEIYITQLNTQDTLFHSLQHRAFRGEL
jgi:type I restriction enzyme, S subunit